MNEKIVEINYKGKPIKVVVGKISWLKAQKLIGESTEIIDGQSRIRMDTLRINLVKYAIKNIEGANIRDYIKFLDEISTEDGNKILGAALELNPLEQIMAV